MTGNKILKILLAIFLGSTLILATVVTILFARGGFITDNGLVTNTGILRIQIDPGTVQYIAYINEQPQTVSDKRINNIIAGTYIVKIQAEGYSEWTKSVSISKGLVTDIYVKLYPLTTSTTQVTMTNIDKAFFSRDGSYIYYVVKESEIGSDEGIWRLPISPSGLFFNQQNQNPIKLSEITEQILTFIDNGTYSITESNDNSKIILKDTVGKKYYILNATELNASPLLTLDMLIDFTANDITWFNGNTDVLISTSNIVLNYNLNTGISTLLEYKPTGPVIFSSNNTSALVYDSNLKSLKSFLSQKLTNIELKNMTIPDNVNSIKLSNSNNDIVYLGTTEGTYHYINIKKLFIKEISSLDGKPLVLKELSNDGTAAIFCDSANNCYTFTAKENVGLNTIETVFSFVANVKCQDEYVHFSPQSNQVIYYDSTTKAIKAMEPDGTNTVILVTDTGLMPYANLNYKGDYLYVLITEGTPTPKNNIYKVQLDAVT